VSERNGDTARFHRNRKRKLLRRMRVRALHEVIEQQKVRPSALAPPAVGAREPGRQSAELDADEAPSAARPYSS
jgi:hypothetical protein